jgi:hypothetical protein
VDCQVNASASFRRGIWSMIVGSDLVLTIGMPLVAGLSVRQLAGVLAHEFGHFSQGAGMRLTYIIRSVSHWFTRVVYERDNWDEWLARSTEGLDLRIAWVLYLARLFIWLTRKILWVLMMIGHTVSGFMLRQMEFDADRYEVRLVGSDAFESTFRRLVELSVANDKAHSDLSGFYREGRLGDNLPRLTSINVEQMPDELKQHLKQSVAESTTGLLDTHPADRDRIAAAHRENAVGIFHLERRASDLFVHYDHLCKNVTWDFYRAIFGPQFQPSDMHPLDDLLERQEHEKGAYEALDRYYLGGFSLLRGVRLPTAHLAAPQNPKAAAERVKQARQRLTEARPDYGEAFTAYDQADTDTIQAVGALALYRAQLRVPKDHFRIPVSGRDQVRGVMDKAKTEMARQGTRMEQFEETLGDRLVAALELLYVPQVAARIEDAEDWRDEAYRLLPILQMLARLLNKTSELRNQHATLGLLFSHFQGNENNDSLRYAIIEAANELRDALNYVHSSVGKTPYPFEHAHGEITISHYLIPNVPPDDDLGTLYDAAEQLLERMADLYSRIASRLAVFAERVEQVLGLPPLEPPAETREEH